MGCNCCHVTYPFCNADRWLTPVSCSFASQDPICTPRTNRYPHVWNKAVFHFLHIFCIARKVPYENFLLVQKAPQQDRKEWDQERDRPPRAEREWDADKEPDSPSIHWMPHVRIGAGIDDFLICLDADIRRRPTVGLNNPEDSEKRDDNNCVAYKGDPRWYPRETITVI